jgi:broad-specificity NMP kinase
MTLHVCILGIDGSGKSTVTAALPTILAAEAGLVTGSAGEDFMVCAPDEDHLAPGFHPEGLPLSARLSRRLKGRAKQLVDHRKLYPLAKVAQLVCQDAAAQALGRRGRADVIISDGNAVLSAAGRAANYLRAASDGGASLRQPPGTEDLAAAFSYVLDGHPLPPDAGSRLPRLQKARALYRLLSLSGLRGVWLPDAVVFLDLPPETAVERIASRGKKVDRHENPADLAQARQMYVQSIEAYERYRSAGITCRVEIQGLSPGEVVAEVVEKLLPGLRRHEAQERGRREARLGTSEHAGQEVKKTALDPRYLVRYLIAKAHRGAWREPTFVLSRLGRLLLEEGYSAGVMREIYERDERRDGILDRIFLEYPLHRAVYDRLQILTREVEGRIETRLATGEEVNIFTAPSGFAYDVFRPLENIVRRGTRLADRVRLVAADLDPHGEMERELEARAEALGIRFSFVRGDMTEAATRRRFEEEAPFDLALFVGLSAWLPKPGTVEHLRWLRKNLSEKGVLVTDCFTPDAYALSGRYVGYKASYYEPDVYRVLADYCGFEGRTASVESGRDGINHVVSIRPRT